MIAVNGLCYAPAGVDSAWEQDAKRLEARKMLENAAESPASSAYHPGARAGRFVSQLCAMATLSAF